MTEQGVSRGRVWRVYGRRVDFTFSSEFDKKHRIGKGPASDGFEIFGEERVSEEALAADWLDEAALEELFLGGVDCRGGAEGVTVAVGVVETGGGFAGKGGQKGLLGGREGEHLLFVLVAVESGEVGAHPGEPQALTKKQVTKNYVSFPWCPVGQTGWRWQRMIVV